MPEQAPLLAVVPARGGSKRLPRKNVLSLAGKPLIGWTIEAALSSGVFKDVLVSTDDEEIAQVSRDFGALVPWLRPAELATDTARSADVLRHALAWYESQHGPVEAVVLLQPTSPFRSKASIQAAVAQYLAEPIRKTLVSVSPAAVHPAWCFTLDDTKMTPLTGWEPLQRRSQDLTPAYALNGSIYIIPPSDLRADRPLLSPDARAFVMNQPDEAHDIDTETDWRVAALIAESMTAIAPTPTPRVQP